LNAMVRTLEWMHSPDGVTLLTLAP